MPFKNPERAKECSREYYLKHRQELIAYGKRYYQEHKEEFEGRRKQYYQNHPEKKKERVRLQYERIKQKREQLRQEVEKLLGEQCFACGKKGRLELHHKVYGLEGGYFNHCRAQASIIIRKEALIHPERFALLCWRCHMVVTTFEKYPKIKDKILSFL